MKPAKKREVWVVVDMTGTPVSDSAFGRVYGFTTKAVAARDSEPGEDVVRYVPAKKTKVKR